MLRAIKNKNFTYKDFIASIDGFEKNYKDDISDQVYFGFPIQTLLNAESALISEKEKSVAYFSME